MLNRFVKLDRSEQERIVNNLDPIDKAKLFILFVYEFDNKIDDTFDDLIKK